ncbi:MAG: hypothetical protein Kow00128_09190 [Deltaproteobacteria bacterium]
MKSRSMNPLVLSRCMVRLAILLAAVFLVRPAPPVDAYTAGDPLSAYSVPEKFRPNGSFDIFVRTERGWTKGGTLPFDWYYREKTVRLHATPAESGALDIRLVRKGGGNAQIDRILLNGEPARKVIGARETDAPKLVASRDFDVLDIGAGSLIFRFPVDAPTLSLSLVARIEGKRLATTPFLFPVSNQGHAVTADSSFYPYRWNSMRTSTSAGAKRIGGGSPFLREYCRSGSGHPSSEIYAWVGNDDDRLYVHIDLTGDNTRDGDKDYTKVYARTRSGVREFRISEGETRWGKPSFTYTDKVRYRHKVYDFSIPRSELGAVDATGKIPLQLAFAAYGTMIPLFDVVSTVPDNNAVGVPVTTTISATFTLPVDTATVDNTTFVVERTGDGTPVSGSFSFSPDNATVIFTPSSALDNGTNYTATLPSDGIYDQSGFQYLFSDYTWNFTTAGGDNSVILFWQNTPSIFGCAVAPGRGTWKESAGTALLFVFPALALLVRRKTGQGARRTLFRGLFLLLPAAALTLASLPAQAGPLGPPQASVGKGKFGAAIGYFYTEDKWEPDTASQSSGGVTVRWETDKVKQNSVFLRGAYGFSGNCEASVKVGIADRGAPQGFEDSYAFIAGVGAKGILYGTPSFSVGPILDFTWYSNYEDDISFSQGGTTWRGTEKIEDSWDLQVGIGIQAPVGTGLVYGGPSFYWNRADVTYRISNGSVNLDVNNRYNQKNSFGGFAGVRYPISDRIGIEIEGQYRSEFSGGATILYSF